jgi:hypothetical protein
MRNETQKNEALELIAKTLADLNWEINNLDMALSVSVIEDSFVLTTGSIEDDTLRVYGHWPEGHGWKHFLVLPWHVCGVVCFSEHRADSQLAKLNVAGPAPTAKFGKMHIRLLRSIMHRRLIQSRDTLQAYYAEQIN